MIRMWRVAVLVVLAVGQASVLNAVEPPLVPPGPPSPDAPARVDSQLMPEATPASSPSLSKTTPDTPAPAPEPQEQTTPRWSKEAAPVFSGSRLESPVTLEWVGPSVTQVGQQGDYTLRVRNGSHQVVNKVVVNVRLGNGMTAKKTTPSASVEQENLVWQFESLSPQQEKTLQMQLVTGSRGEVTPQATVTYTGQSTASLRIRVHEPKLALKVASPTRALAGDPANFILTVTNTGDCTAGRVKVRASLSEGLEHAQGKNMDFEVGDLPSGESRTMQLVCLAGAGGEQKCDVVAESGGCVLAQEHGVVNVLAPRLEIELTGPALRYVDRKAAYTLRVANRGEVHASNLSVKEVIPAGFKFVSANDGGHLGQGSPAISWFLGELAPGQVRQVQFELQAVKAGEHRHRATVSSERGARIEFSRELVTRVEDFSALSLEIAHADDAIEVGKETTYEVLVSNAGSRMETNIKLMCNVPDKMEFMSAPGSMRYHREGNAIIFEPVARLAPRSDVVYQIKVKALTPGDVRFKTQVTSTNLVEPVSKTEATRIYSDRP
jgi:uncharacterized repeat protein (TIGR01451 family)